MRKTIAFVVSLLMVFFIMGLQSQVSAIDVDGDPSQEEAVYSSVCPGIYHQASYHFYLYLDGNRWWAYSAEDSWGVWGVPPYTLLYSGGGINVVQGNPNAVVLHMLYGQFLWGDIFGTVWKGYDRGITFGYWLDVPPYRYQLTRAW